MPDNTKIPDLPEVSTPANDDLLYMVDTSDTTDSDDGSSKFISYLNLANAILALVAIDWGDIGGTLADQTDLQAELDSLASDITDGDAEKLGIAPRVGTDTTISSPDTLEIDVDAYDMYEVTAQDEALTIDAVTGTPANGQRLVIRLTDDGTTRALTFDASFRFSSDLAAPTATTAGKTLYLGFIYNSTDSKWDCVAILDNF